MFLRVNAMKRRSNGFTLIELVMTLVIVSVMASAFVSLFVPQIQLFLTLPATLRVQDAAEEMMCTIIEGHRRGNLARGIRFAEALPSSVAKLSAVNGITYADPDEIRYTYHDSNRVSHAVRFYLDTNNNSMVRLVDNEAYSVLRIISSGGVRGTGGIQIFPGGANGDGNDAIFRYFRADGTELTGFANSVIPTANLSEINRVDIAYRANTGGSQISSYQSEVLKRSSVNVKRTFFPEPGDWDFQFADRNADNAPDMMAIKKNDGGTAAGSTVVELHAFNGPDLDAESFSANTAMAEAGDLFEFLIADCGSGAGTAQRQPDGVLDLVRFQKSNAVTTARVQMTITSVANLAGAPYLNTTLATTVPNVYQEEYDFAFADQAVSGSVGDGVPDLYVIRRIANSSQVSIRIFNGSPGGTTVPYTTVVSGTSQFTKTLPSQPFASDANRMHFFVARWNQADQHPDLIALYTRGTPSGNVEVRVFAGAATNLGAPFQGFILGSGIATVPTIIPIPEGNNINFRVADWNNDGTMDIVGIQRNNTVSRSTVVRVLSGIPDAASGVLNGILRQDGTAMPEVNNIESLPS